MAYTPYSQQLKDPRWQRRRLEVLNRSDFKCEWCDASDKTLHVHHTIYHKGMKPWEYKDCELLALCEDCHAEWHHMKDGIDSMLSAFDNESIERLWDFACLLSEGADVDVVIKKAG